MFDPHQKFPIPAVTRLGFLKNFITNPNIVIGDFTYYDDPAGVENFENNCVLYHFDFIGDKLIIGKYCQIASGAKFIMNGANHGLTGFTTYPFKIFAEYSAVPLLSDNKGDTVVGNDVWIGYDVTIMPGIEIGDGAIIASKSVVTKSVAPYTIVGGNPAQLIRKRFSDQVIVRLLKIQWWNWTTTKIKEYAPVLLADDINKLMDVVN
ncbi:MAG: CatB-related O-acetyltransferase [Bacillota bacterium]